MAKKTITPSVPIVHPLPIRVAKLHAKLLIAVVLGIVVALAMTPFELSWLARVLAGWDVGVVVYLALTYPLMWRADVAHIRRRAAEQDEGAAFILFLSIVATFASFIAIVFALGGAKAVPAEAATHVLLAIATIVLSWTFVHTIFSFHYAHEYYSKRADGKIGGLIFPYDETPDYRDFLYFSLVIGMTSQTSDVAICSKVIRRMAAIHGVLSFFFNLVVLALTVNMVANLI
jgi:uncharacterized membrane protein